MAATTISELPRSVSFGPVSETNRRSHSVVSIGLLNENGESDLIEIDEADDVLKASTKDNNTSTKTEGMPQLSIAINLLLIPVNIHTFGR